MRGGLLVDPSFARQYYESAVSDHWWFRGRHELISGLLGRFGVRDGIFLDLGAGSESLFPERLSVVKLDLVRPQRPPARFVQGDASALPFRDGQFDGVGLFDVLEHLPDPCSSLMEVSRVIRPGGALAVTVPAFRWLWSPHDDLVGHLRRYEASELEAILEDSGFKVLWMGAFYRFLLIPALVRAAFALQSPMEMPPKLANRLLSGIAVRSSQRVLSRPSKLGLSIAALATVGR